MMETLLTSAESMAFQSFLSSVDTSQPPSDWATYASQFNPDTIQKHNDDMLDSLPSPQDNDPLTKATKDLMSLDTGMWADNGMLVDHIQSHQHQYFNHHGQMHQPLQHHGHSRSLPIQSPQPLSFPTAHDSFPFLSSKQQAQHPELYQQHQPFLPDRGQPFSEYPSQNFHHMPQMSGSGNGMSFVNSSSQNQHPPLPHTQSQSNGTGPSSSGLAKRPIRAASVSRTSSSSSPSTAGPSTSKRSTANTADRNASSSQSPHPNANTSKPALLSPSQKKANHIQSEQKRRANIRRGYEALCDTVPALREAIREEEEETKAAALAAAVGLSNGKGKSSKKRNGAKKKDGEDAARDKIDGRAGPRSENVVLSKTIEYINDLLSDKAALMSRLQRARSLLPPGHPATVSLSPNPAWEREWKGGEGKEGNDDGDESDEGDDDNDDEGSVPPPPSAGGRKKGKNSE